LRSSSVIDAPPLTSFCNARSGAAAEVASTLATADGGGRVYFHLGFCCLPFFGLGLFGLSFFFFRFDDGDFIMVKKRKNQ